MAQEIPAGRPLDQRRDWRYSLVKAHLYIEGGGPSKWDKIGCREGFRKLLQKSGFSDHPPGVTLHEAYSQTHYFQRRHQPGTK